MFRMPSTPRKAWQQKAKEFGFTFHSMYGEPYWDESAYYQFTLKQIEDDLEAPTQALHDMCLAVVDEVCKSEALLEQFRIPETFWQPIADSWRRQDPSLYSRLDFAYDGKNPAKLYENNADTPTSLYESGFWQWLWLQDLVDANQLSRQSDQFNSLQEKLIHRMREISRHYGIDHLHFACCQDTIEDRGTVQYLQDCAAEAGLKTPFVFIEDIGIGESGRYTDMQNNEIETLFKLYPWEFMQREEFAEHLIDSATNWIEPLWKSILSNKALMPMLWKKFTGHPNLLPAYFDHELHLSNETKLVKKPIFSREGANISILEAGKTVLAADGPYGEEGFIYQAYSPLPRFDQNYTLIGSWLVDNQAAGISVREDTSLITQDMSRYLPHIILG
ncbi:glutathionylspermidine synthase family protein [Aliiglaciecola litoralis]|uniref:Glutathionylspermidine synthase family protein n=1 Tax=Aliiglaciecola litoralis TaxID=582857 RepID=A0ABN1LMD7_9ALTE